MNYTSNALAKNLRIIFKLKRFGDYSVTIISEKTEVYIQRYSSLNIIMVVLVFTVTFVFSGWYV